ncbi:restriction endonuclease, SacI family [Clostridium perfringens]|uniref:restriction endonuclease, SacI family n=1 Tax=Clostridium perfringens TaxID=1502 RepID=UPI0032195576
MKVDLYQLSNANLKLEQALKIAKSKDYKPKSEFYTQICTILSSDSRTYKYILITELLAKSCCNDINPICLQIESNLPGAYDARQFCKKYFVPFENKYLNNVLGGSNDPLVSNPARNPELSVNNKYRGEKVKRILTYLCDFLPKVKSSELAFLALTDAIYYTLQLARNKENTISSLKEKNVNLFNIENFIKELLKQSCGGESLVLSIGTLLTLYSNIIDGDCKIDVHKVNQSGASSNEISDIDFYKDGNIFYAIEAKDKDFSAPDVKNAVLKSIAGGCSKLMFITGPHATLKDSTYDFLINDAIKDGVYLTFLSYSTFTKIMLALIPQPIPNETVKIIFDIADKAKFKDSTITHIINTAKNTTLID